MKLVKMLTKLVMCLAVVWFALSGRWTLAAGVGSDDLLNADANNSDWLMYGRTYNNWRFSPLARITPDNVANLRPVWGLSTGSVEGMEATPLVYGGAIYFTGDHSQVFAADARTGRMLWRYTPKYEEGLEAELCCGPVNRGLAIKGDLLYVETLDARLVALDRHTGNVVWEKTLGNWKEGVTATGVPVVIRNHVIAGIAGAEYGVRGFIKSYHATTGELEWTTYTIPGPGEPGNETWPGDTWKTGGGTTWQPGSYDPELNQLYWGTGNPGPWNSDLRKGDNLWTSAVISLNPDTGKINWGFQYTPNDPFDYDGNNVPLLMDVTVDGKPVKALVTSNRNGYFYMLDRTNGKFIYAEPTIDGINWNTGIDPKTGRATINEKFRPKSGGETKEAIVPGLEGGTNWFPMAYNPELGYVFLATNHWAMSMTAHAPEKVVYRPGEAYMGVDFQMFRIDKNIGYVKAFDVSKKKFVWETPNSLPLFSGMLATKGGLVFTGDLQGYFQALDARTGKVLWKFQTGSGINASPITFELDGVQYVAILSGLGGDPSFYYSAPKGGMLWVFALENPAIDVKATSSSRWSAEEIDGALPLLESK